MMLYLFVNSLFHPRMPGTPKQIFDHPTPVQPPSQVIDRANLSESGIFSAFTSYVSSFASDEPPEPSDSEIESSLCTIDCIGACPLDEILNNITCVYQRGGGSNNRARLMYTIY